MDAEEELSVPVLDESEVEVGADEESLVVVIESLLTTEVPVETETMAVLTAVDAELTAAVAPMTWNGPA